MSNQADRQSIEETILAAILAGKINPGTRLGEAALAKLFSVSRTRVREAMMRLETRGVVQVSPRRGWFVVEPSAEEAREAYQARRVIEAGLLHTLTGMAPEQIGRLKAHLARERAALAAGDVGESTALLGDFHTLLAGLLGNRLLTDVLRDLTARTTLISMLYQSRAKAGASSCEHHEIVAALEAGDFPGAARLMDEHIRAVEDGLDLHARPDPLSGLHAFLPRERAGPDESDTFEEP
ncbi:GntR family transcriptional regulator [Methylobacterium trifolii]|uniref:HTH-type transcriptional repressor RspR n=1 Tax=Methylobacterium trifolii TaxID=1003092 RepID=A0ABQ4TTQ6_9HYPH|nr:GntR family transcriptional regulator [Methylobacterium trifolii]GJE58062.1 HTH-type transcriptional repressor RspR [Methylobacterium trifolii]